MPGPAAAQGKGKFTFLTPFTLSLAFAPVLYAQATGKFSARKLDLRVEVGRGAAQVVQLAAAGQVDAGRTGGANYMSTRAQDNSDVIAFGTIAQISPFVVISDEKAPVREAKDLAGKIVGLASFGGSMEATLNLMLAHAGVDPKSVRRERVADGPASFAMIQAGRLHAFFGNTSTVSRLRAEHLAASVMHADDGVPGQVYVARERDLAAHRDAFVAFTRGVVDSVKELAAMDDQALLAAIALMGKAFDIPGIEKTDIALQDLRGNRELWLTHGVENVVRNDPKQWAEGRRLLVEAGLMRPTERPLYTNDIWESAVA
ncbi:ABC transporter substrate-binding protein [Achromobacter denitrificans]|nr:ABC transporter substrate-binding protein [Achromobacter denitrificans]MBV2159740.1 ABC transporter substrate-binding protein [Achromobacter denitrificans]MDX3882101.1 ABC transporter substrate-binding protein [Achromobacter sp.]OLU09276.1 hypothetical protein BVK87_06395 [Achromobacter denitrificans]GFN25006.1 hypothetical protein ADE_07040 [Achromobacter denitrificans]